MSTQVSRQMLPEGFSHPLLATWWALGIEEGTDHGFSDGVKPQGQTAEPYTNPASEKSLAVALVDVVTRE